jgi:AMMECR1 domain-containing protein
MGAPLSDEQGQLLVRLAIDAVYAKLTGVPHPPAPPSDPALLRPGGSFVTLESQPAPGPAALPRRLAQR